MEMYSGKQAYENEPEVDNWRNCSLTKSDDRRPCNWKCTRRFFFAFMAVAIVGMLSYIVYRMENPRDVTREISLLRDELQAVKTEFEKMPNLPHQSDKMNELISKMETMTQQLYDASQLKNQEAAKLTQEHADMKTTLNKVNEKIGAVNQKLQAQSQEMGELKMSLEGVDSMREDLREMKEDMRRMRNDGNGSRSSSTPSGMIYICCVVAMYLLFTN